MSVENDLRAAYEMAVATVERERAARLRAESETQELRAHVIRLEGFELQAAAQQKLVLELTSTDNEKSPMAVLAKVSAEKEVLAQTIKAHEETIAAVSLERDTAIAEKDAAVLELEKSKEATPLVAELPAEKI